MQNKTRIININFIVKLLFQVQGERFSKVTKNSQDEFDPWQGLKVGRKEMRWARVNPSWQPSHFHSAQSSIFTQPSLSYFHSALATVFDFQSPQTAVLDFHSAQATVFEFHPALATGAGLSLFKLLNSCIFFWWGFFGRETRWGGAGG